MIDTTPNILKKISIVPERFPNSNNSKWIRIHFTNGNTCLGYYNFKEGNYREFNDIKNLNHTTALNEKVIKGWHY